MTEEEKVAVQNEAIALFDGWICVDGGWRKYNGKQLESFHKKPLNYHSSWDSLKPVIDKIFTYALAYPEQVQPIIKMSIVVEIKAAHEAVFKFITWLNQQSTDHQ